MLHTAPMNMLSSTVPRGSSDRASNLSQKSVFKSVVGLDYTHTHMCTHIHKPTHSIDCVLGSFLN